MLFKSILKTRSTSWGQLWSSRLTRTWKE